MIFEILYSVDDNPVNMTFTNIDTVLLCPLCYITLLFFLIYNSVRSTAGELT